MPTTTTTAGVRGRDCSPRRRFEVQAPTQPSDSLCLVASASAVSHSPSWTPASSISFALMWPTRNDDVHCANLRRGNGHHQTKAVVGVFSLLPTAKTRDRERATRTRAVQPLALAMDSRALLLAISKPRDARTSSSRNRLPSPHPRVAMDQVHEVGGKKCLRMSIARQRRRSMVGSELDEARGKEAIFPPLECPPCTHWQATATFGLLLRCYLPALLAYRWGREVVLAPTEWARREGGQEPWRKAC